MPYFGVDPVSGQQIGLLKDLVTEATNKCCGNCTNGHGTTTVLWREVFSVVEMNDAIMNGTEFVLPVETDKDRATYKDRPIVGMVESPGVSIFSLQKQYLNPTNNMMLDAVLMLWSFVVIVSVIVLALGMFMWIVVCFF